MREKIENIRQYVAQKQGGSCQVGDHDDIIENRLIDSLQFVEFILYIEEQSGTAIDKESLNIEDFRTISSIEKAFF